MNKKWLILVSMMLLLMMVSGVALAVHPYQSGNVGGTLSEITGSGTIPPTTSSYTPAGNTIVNEDPQPATEEDDGISGETVVNNNSATVGSPEYGAWADVTTTTTGTYPTYTSVTDTTTGNTTTPTVEGNPDSSVPWLNNGSTTTTPQTGSTGDTTSTESTGSTTGTGTVNAGSPDTSLPWINNVIPGTTAPDTVTTLPETGIGAEGSTDDGTTTSSGTQTLNWSENGQALLKQYPNIRVYDIKTGITWSAKYINGSRHADVIPASASDATTIANNNITGSYVRRPVIVTINGTQYAGSMYAVGHGSTSYCSYFKGVMCIHFTGSSTHGSQQVDSDHQNAIGVALEYGNSQ